MGKFSRLRRKCGRLNVVCWNMRSLVEGDGSVETARTRQDHRVQKGAVEKKSVLMVWEMRRYKTFAAAISETKWFGSRMYEVEGHLILHSGRRPPGEGEQVRRGEGVGIVLSPEAARAWKEGGGEWSPVSSRMVTARLKMRGGKHLFLVSVYAPTFRAPDQEKEDFYSDLQEVIDSVSDRDVLVIMGDWNARVGSNVEDGQWDRVLGMHGLGRMNEAGLNLLSFCAVNNLSIMNTFFMKRDIYKQTWQHPGTKVWHSIDFFVMRHCQQKWCLDVQVMRGAGCWSDHRMVRARLRMNLSEWRARASTCSAQSQVKRPNMSQCGGAVCF